MEDREQAERGGHRVSSAARFTSLSSSVRSTGLPSLKLSCFQPPFKALGLLNLFVCFSPVQMRACPRASA